MLKLGGSVTIRLNGLEMAFNPGMSLPPEAFQLTDVRLGDQLELTDAGFEPFEGLPNLVGFSLNKGPKITDAGIAHLRNLPRLESLWLQGTRVTDRGLGYLEGLTQLKDLRLDGTGVTSAGLVHLRRLTQLTGLGLDGTAVTNAGLVHLQGLTQLKELRLKNTNVSAADAAEFKKIIPACQIITEPAGTTDLEKWQGIWVETTCEWNGQNVAFDAERPRWTTTIQGNRYTVTDANGNVIEALTFRLIPGRTPKAIDVQITAGPNAGQRNAGIYQLDGDNLKICWPIAGQERPTEFTTKNGSGVCFQTWKRSR